MSSAVQVLSIDGADIYAGGGFTTVGGNQQSYLALFTERALPVQLRLFKANVSEDKVTLNWLTETEINNYGFEIQRYNLKTGHAASLQWEKIGFVHGNGNSNSPKSYSFTDAFLPSGKVKYGFKQIDFDGGFEFCEIVEVITLVPKEFLLKQNYPNPFNPSTNIRFGISEASFVTLKVYNIMGQEITTLVNNQLRAGIIQSILMVKILQVEYIFIEFRLMD